MPFMIYAKTGGPEGKIAKRFGPFRTEKQALELAQLVADEHRSKTVTVEHVMDLKRVRPKKKTTKRKATTRKRRKNGEAHRASASRRPRLLGPPKGYRARKRNPVYAVETPTGAKTTGWITREGKLGGPGYTDKPAATRHKLLARSVGVYGYASTLGSLQALLRGRMAASKKKKIKADKNWLMKRYGGRD